jgi:hypothetical protein
MFANKKNSKTNFFLFKYMEQYIDLYFKETQAFKIITI